LRDVPIYKVAMSAVDLKRTKALIEKIKRIVEPLEEPYRSIAFEVILREEYAASASEAVAATKSTAQPAEDEIVSVDGRVKKLCEQVGLSVEQLSTVFVFEPTRVEFIAPIRGNDADKQRMVSLSVLAVDEFVYGREWTRSSEIVDILKKLGVGSLQNFSGNMKAKGEDVRKRGRGKGVEYKLTPNGKTGAIKIIRHLAGGTVKEV